MPEFVLEDDPAGFAKIKVVGVGGGGCNAVDSMFDLGIQNVDFHVVNSDLQALKRSKCPNRIQIGAELTLGRGCGADPRLGAKCMEDAKEIMIDALQGADIVFVTAGLGGGTGTGASPVVAAVAKEMGILTVSIVTKPFKFEGPRRMRSADSGLDRIREGSDTVIVINNERLLDVVGPKVPMKEAFQTADKVLSQAVSSISDLVTTPGLINVDFNDIKTIMGGKGGAVMGIGVGKGESRATEAVKKATSSPLLDKVVIDGATGLLICITGGQDMTLQEVSEATDLVSQAADPDAEIIFGAVVDENMEDTMRVTLIATGFSDELHRSREVRKAMESAPVAPPRRVATPVLDDIMADVEASPVFNESPRQPASAPAPRAEASRRQGPSLRDSINDLVDEADTEKPIAPPTNGGSSPRRAAADRVDENGIRVAPSRSREAYDAEMKKQAPAPAPEHPRVRRAVPEKASVPQFTPGAEEKKEEQDYDTPAFLRRRRSLFD